MAFSLLFSVGLIATCGLIYELVAGALASYLLGDSITQFSLIIGVYLFSMGIGSFLSRYIEKNITYNFVQVEFLVGIIGGLSAPLLFLSFEYVQHFRLILFFFVVLTGTLVGLEIPLMMRILKDKMEFKDLVGHIFTFDYVGALFASLLFPLVMVPYLGLSRTSLFFGVINILVGLYTIKILGRNQPWSWKAKSLGLSCLIILIAAFGFSQKIERWTDSLRYMDPIVFSQKSPYQKIVITTQGSDYRLFINGNLQFDTKDEYRYHEALVHPAMLSKPDAKNILILGGGDGMALREVWKYPQVEKATLVDLDPLMTSLFKDNPLLAKTNGFALQDPRLTIINEDAFSWLRRSKERFDLIIIDFPDPSNYGLGKLYTRKFYHLLSKALKPEGVFSIQSTSPYFARKSYWIIFDTIKSVGYHALPYHAYVPSFGEWGYFLAAKRPLEIPKAIREDLKFINEVSLSQMFTFPKDMDYTQTGVNKLGNQILVRVFEDEWSRVN